MQPFVTLCWGVGQAPQVQVSEVGGQDVRARPSPRTLLMPTRKDEQAGRTTAPALHFHGHSGLPPRALLAWE